MTSVRRAFVVMSLIATTAVAAPAGAGPDAQVITGNWVGFSHDGLSNTLALGEVYLQDGRRFEARLSLEDQDCLLKGTISASLRLSATGDCGALGSHPELYGNIWIDQTEVPDVATLHWVLSDAFGRSRQGELGLLHDEGGPKHLVDGTWQGEVFDEDGNRAGEISADFGRSEDGPVNEIRFEDTQGKEQVFEVVLDLSNPSEPESPFGFAAVGGGEDGLMLLSGQFTPATDDRPATIEGRISFPNTSPSGGDHLFLGSYNAGFP